LNKLHSDNEIIDLIKNSSMAVIYFRHMKINNKSKVAMNIFHQARRRIALIARLLGQFADAAWWKIGWQMDLLFFWLCLTGKALIVSKIFISFCKFQEIFYCKFVWSLCHKWITVCIYARRIFFILWAFAFYINIFDEFPDAIIILEYSEFLKHGEEYFFML